jgi:hypothetical protein
LIPYLAFDGLTISWSKITNALKAIRPFCCHNISESERTSHPQRPLIATEFKLKTQIKRRIGLG